MSMQGKVALVAGGSRGIGFAIAERLGGQGAHICIASRKPGEAAEKLRSQGLDVIALEVDLAEQDPQAVVDATVEHFGGIDALVYSSGTNVRKPILELSLKQWRLIHRINLEGAFLSARAAAPHMLERGWGRMLFISSIAGFHGGAVLPITAYSASKAGLNGLVRGLAKEWAPGGIRVNALAPGFTRTELTEPVQNHPELSASVNARIPVGRWAEPGDMAGIGAFLCSDEADYITGQSIIVDGGYLLF
ncbi:MAG: SDR family oxidoreductase [Actinomycetota bacterium]|nr:SDR family oxidoreductase [Actinomycetota bacterium]